MSSWTSPRGPLLRYIVRTSDPAQCNLPGSWPIRKVIPVSDAIQTQLDRHGNPVIARVCQECGTSCLALVSDVRRGQGLYCSRRCAGLSRATPLDVFVTRFWSRVDQNGPIARVPLSRCWIWQGARFRYGYGKCRLPRSNERLAHRVAWIVTFSGLPDQASNGARCCVLHACDNGPLGCVNPAHLFLGTNDDNVVDMLSKQRQAHGSHHYRARLTERDVLSIRAQYAEGRTIAQLSSERDRPKATIRRIVTRAGWTHI